MQAKALVIGLGLFGLIAGAGAASAHQHPSAGMVIHHPGDPDAYVIIDGHPVQLEYLACVGERGVKWYEDGSPQYCKAIGQPGRRHHR